MNGEWLKTMINDVVEILQESETSRYLPVSVIGDHIAIQWQGLAKALADKISPTVILATGKSSGYMKKRMAEILKEEILHNLTKESQVDESWEDEPDLAALHRDIMRGRGYKPPEDVKDVAKEVIPNAWQKLAQEIGALGKRMISKEPSQADLTRYVLQLTEYADQVREFARKINV